MRPASSFNDLTGEMMQAGGVEVSVGGRQQMHGACLAGKQPALVDGLVGTNGLQFGGAVGGNQDQRHAGLIGLDHCRQPVGRGTPGGGDDDDRHPAGLGDAEREECRATFIDDDGAGHVRLPQKGQRQRCRTRSRRDHRLPDPSRLQTGDEDLRPAIVERSGVHEKVSL